MHAVRRPRPALRSDPVRPDALDAVVWETTGYDPDRYDRLSPSATSILGYPGVNLIQLGFWLDHVHPDDRRRVIDSRAGSARHGLDGEVEYRMITSDDRWIWLHEIVSVDSHGREPTLRGIVTDVTDRRSAEDARALYAEIVEHIDTALFVARLHPNTNTDLRTIAANPAAARLVGIPTPELVESPIVEHLTRIGPDVHERASAVARGGESFSIERVEGFGVDGQKVHSVQVFGLPDRAVGIALEDVTSAAMVAAALRRQALHDGLTGLPNRTLLRDRLTFALQYARRRQERVALILMDLNHFKEVNDALGHQYGDLLLTAFATRLQTLLRECDTIARLGGDEFALLVTNATDEGASRLVKKVTEAMQEPFELDGVTVQATASLGVALFPDHADDADLLTRRADVAMYNAKRSGGGWSVYSSAHDRSSVERLTLLSDLHRELEEGIPVGISLHYQPILDLSTDQIAGAEALLRWNHPVHGNLNPELVVELAELSGLIRPLAKMVAGQALASCKWWSGSGHDVRVAINLSARNLYPGFRS